MAELDKKKKLEEENELQKMKARQREKAKHLEERKQLEEERRREQFFVDHVRTNENFLLKVDKTAADLTAHPSTMSKDLKNKVPEKLPKSVEEVQHEHMRVNKAFLDRLEQQSRESTNETIKETVPNMESLSLVPDSFKQTTGHVSLSHLKADPEQSCSGLTKRTEPEPDHDWALMKLINHFPDCSKSFLEDILHQCDSNYDQAYTLLISTLS